MTGLSLMAAGNYWLSRMNLDIGPWDVVWPRVVTIAGLALLVTPLNVSVYQNAPLQHAGRRGRAVAGGFSGAAGSRAEGSLFQLRADQAEHLS